MPEMTKHEFGTFSWLDLSTTDIEGAKDFYGTMFGWEFEPQVVEGELVYTICTLNGLQVCGLGGTMGEDDPPCWNVYTCVEDVDATSNRAVELGGKIEAGPMDIFDSGRMSFISDPQGAMLGLWQPREHLGVQVMFEPGTFMWAEIMTWDAEGTNAFYQGLHGWDTVADHSNPNYTLYVPGGDTSRTVYLAGQLAMDENFDKSIPTYWGIYLQVSDTAETLRRCIELGGEQAVPATEIAQGTFAGPRISPCGTPPIPPPPAEEPEPRPPRLPSSCHQVCLCVQPGKFRHLDPTVVRHEVPAAQGLTALNGQRSDWPSGRGVSRTLCKSLGATRATSMILEVLDT
ncbi:MAG: VOC family protein [Caldilineaceae bacterium]|nr:VOC family protein [Caldilineaceae bacterium]